MYHLSAVNEKHVATNTNSKRLVVRPWGSDCRSTVDARDSSTEDARLVRQLKRGSELRVEATSARNTRVTYHFSLAGSSAAIDRAASTCR